MSAMIVALVAALLFALASVLQQNAAARVPDTEAMKAGLLLRLARRPLWLLGVVCDSVGFAAQAIALGIGSLMVVQPLLVTTLLFALPLGRWINRRRILRTDWLWAGVLTVSLAVFIDVGNPAPGVDRASFAHWIVPLVIVGFAASAGMVMGMRATASRRALLLGIAAGLLFGLSSALTKSVMSAFDAGMGDALGLLLRNWETYVLAASLALGFLLQQTSYQAGSLTAALPPVVVLDPVVSMLIGAVVLAEALEPSMTFGWGFIVLAAAAMLVATLRLAHTAAASEEAQLFNASSEVSG